MKTTILIAFAVMLFFCSCSTAKFYIVRHAEKLDESADPPLSKDGFRRAVTLMDTLDDKHIGKIYISNRRRTAQTAKPTADHFSLTPVVFDETQTNALITELKSQKSKNMLVVRHSGEIHLIVNALSPDDQIQPIGNVFNLMFVVTRRVFLWQRKYSLKRLTYGEQ